MNSRHGLFHAGLNRLGGNHNPLGLSAWPKPAAGQALLRSTVLLEEVGVQQHLRQARCLFLEIAKEIVDPEDVELLEDAILSAVKEAITGGKDLAQSEMTKITGGLGIPGL